MYINVFVSLLLTVMLSLIVKLMALLLNGGSTNSHHLRHFIPAMVSSHLVFPTKC